LPDFEPEQLARLSALALRLDAPGEEPFQLNQYDVADLGAGWLFPVETVEDGPWLIYPVPDCPLPFRPLLWTIGAEKDVPIEYVVELPEVLRIMDAGFRSDQLHVAIRRISEDFRAVDWRTVEQLANQLYNLPFCTLDLWREFAKSRRGLAALAFRAHRFPHGFLERFSNEMPAVWETIALPTWVETMRASQGFEESQLLPNEVPNQVEAVASVHHSLRVILEIAQTICTGAPTEGVNFASKGNFDFARLLFDGEDSPYQKLLRDRANAQWPTGLQAEISRARSTPLGRFFRPVTAHFRDVVVNLPILLATSAALGIPVQWAQVQTPQTLRKYQDFCPEWFADAFDLTMACCLSSGLIKELGS